MFASEVVLIGCSDVFCLLLTSYLFGRCQTVSFEVDHCSAVNAASSGNSGLVSTLQVLLMSRPTVSFPWGGYSSPCSRVTSNPDFISQHFFHFSSFIHSGDNLNLQEKMKFHQEILKKLRFCEKKKICREFCLIH